MNIYQIDHSQIFIKDITQIKEKNRIFNTIPNLILEDKNVNIYPVLSWFNQELKTSYKNLEEIARNISEDICIVKKIDNQYILVSLAVAFLNRWRPLEKIGKNLFQIHQPVPNSKKLMKVVTNFFQLISEDIPYRRKNWGFVNTDELYLPFDKSDNKLFLRTETQTIIKLDNFVIFLIKTDIEQMKDKSVLQDFSKNLSNEMLEYKLLKSKF